MPDNSASLFSGSTVFIEENFTQIIQNSSQKGVVGSCLWSVAVFNYGINADQALTVQRPKLYLQLWNCSSQ